MHASFASTPHSLSHFRSTLPLDVRLTRGRFGWWSFSWLFCAGNIEWSSVHFVFHTSYTHEPCSYIRFLLHYRSQHSSSYPCLFWLITLPFLLPLTCLFLWTNWVSIWLKNPVKSQTFTREIIVSMFTTNWYSLPNGFGYAWPIVLLSLSFSISLFQFALPLLLLLLLLSTLYPLTLTSLRTFLFSDCLLRPSVTTIRLKNPAMFHWDICLGEDRKLIPLGDALSIGLLVIVIMCILLNDLSLCFLFFLVVYTFWSNIFTWSFLLLLSFWRDAHTSCLIWFQYFIF